MGTRAYRGAIDHERLGAYLRALSVPTRILLLQKLQWPRTPSEIELPPFRKDRDLGDDRPLARQTVEGHLRKLEEVGLVRSRGAQRDGQPVREYLLDTARLFVVVDELRRLGVLRAAPGNTAFAPGTDATVTREGGSPAPPMPAGPSLVLVSGPLEGAAFPLAGAGPWTVGRDGAAAVAVPFDPYVSGANAEVWRDGARFFARDLPGSSNGTTVNWRPLAPGEAAALVPGDTLGVGRSLLVLRVP